MKNRAFAALFVLLLSGNTPVFAQTAWEQLFQSTFYNESVYGEGQCTFNVLRYLRMARSKGLDLRKIQAIEITDTLHDFIYAKNARSSNGMDPTSNWYHHVILKAGHTILDYDFTNRPTPAPVQTYFNSMLMSERMKADRQRCLHEIRNVKLTIYSGTDYLRYYDDKVRSSSLNRQEVMLKDTGWMCI
jgi:hypothetical protein